MRTRAMRPWAALFRATALLVLLCGWWHYAARGQGESAATPGESAAPTEGAPAESTPAADSEQGRIPTKNLITILQDGGPVMIPIGACSLALVAVAFERLISLRWGRIIPRPFVKRFIHQLRDGQFDAQQALTVCEANGSPVAEVFAAAVRKWGRPAVEVEQAVLDAGERAANHLRRYLRVLNGVATVSPLLGLLGTVFGMIRTFDDIAALEAMGRPSMLAKGISEALITTAAGLTVAIPALILYMYFASRVDALVIELDALGQEVVNAICGDAERTPGRGRPGRREAAA